MKKVQLVAGLALLFAFPSVSLAAQYHYLNLRGEVVTVEASNASQALAISASRGDSMHSGVVLDIGLLEQGDEYGITYRYQSNLGGTKYVTAASVDAAYVIAPDIIPGTLTVVTVHNG